MASPFDAFRNNRPLMVGLFGLAMFSFVALGVADPSNIGAFMPLIAAILVGGALWYASGKGGWEGGTIAAVGAVVGYAAYAFVPSLRTGDNLVITNAGDLDAEAFRELGRKRAIAENFIAFARNEALSGGAENLPRFESFGPSDAQGLLTLFLLNAEADRLGIEIDDAGVNAFINDLCRDQRSERAFLTAEGYEEARRGVGVSAYELNNALKQQIRAVRAFAALQPRYAPTPDALWDLHRRANVRQSLEVVTFPVEAFAAEVPDPTDAELAGFFGQYRAVLPQQLGPGEPGFRVPRKVQLAFLEASFVDALAEVSDPTAAEVEAFYEDNKSVRYVDPSGGTKAEPEQPPAEESEPESDAPSLGPPPEAGDTEESATETDEADDSTAHDEPAADEESAETAPEPAEEPEAPAAETETESPPTAEDDTAEKVDAGETPTADAGGEPEGPAETPEAPSPEAPAEETSAVPSRSSLVFAQVEDNLTPPEPGVGSFEEFYLPLDDDLRAEISEELKRQKAFEAVAVKAEAARDALGRIVIDAFGDINLADLESEDSTVQAKALAAYKAAVRVTLDAATEYAAANGLTFETTPLLSFPELRSGDDYPIGLAVDPSATSFGARRAVVAEEVFRDIGRRTPVAQVAEEPGGGTRYAYFKIDDREAFAPTMEDEGVRDEVVTAWKRRQALPLAEERAEAFVGSVPEDATLSAAIGDDEGPKTVTDADDALPLRAVTTAPFSWLRRTSAPSPFGFPLPTLEPGDVPEIGAVTDETMAELFDETDVGGITMITSPDRSAVHVVRVRDRTAQSEGDKTALKQEFLGEAVFRFTSPYASIIGRNRQLLVGTWFEELEKRYDVQSADPTFGLN